MELLALRHLTTTFEGPTTVAATTDFEFKFIILTNSPALP